MQAFLYCSLLNPILSLIQLIFESYVEFCITPIKKNRQEGKHFSHFAVSFAMRFLFRGTSLVSLKLQSDILVAL